MLAALAFPLGTVSVTGEKGQTNGIGTLATIGRQNKNGDENAQLAVEDATPASLESKSGFCENFYFAAFEKGAK